MSLVFHPREQTMVPAGLTNRLTVNDANAVRAGAGRFVAVRIAAAAAAAAAPA